MSEPSRREGPAEPDSATQPQPQPQPQPWTWRLHQLVGMLALFAGGAACVRLVRGETDVLVWLAAIVFLALATTSFIAARTFKQQAQSNRTI
ncbi:hypothetical protein ACI3EY_07965 [Ornithinimicrobium sp. LYQ92]|uniref:hypothetical protein n=1 Tax=Serinicoccus sp. LYQ92 TaxID=3378798 RepID=UPI00385236DF